LPGLVVPVTDTTINLPALTGSPKDPINYLGRMLYRLDPQMESGAINMTAGPGDDTERKGIYRIKGNVLTICFGGPDGKRPESYACDGPSESLIVLRVERPAPAPILGPGDPLPPPTSQERRN
jgi:uncharacterized protein (TIGR03067 family)